MTTYLKPYDATGNLLDAKFSVHRTEQGFNLVVESRGGSDHGPNKSRNKHYNEAVETHLLRMQSHGMIIENIYLASRPSLHKDRNDRRLTPPGFTPPIRLSDATDIRTLRCAIGSAGAAFGKTSTQNGNYTKRIEFQVRWPPALKMTEGQIGTLMTGAKITNLEMPTADLTELNSRVNKALTRLRTTPDKENAPPPSGQKFPKKASSNSDHYVRDPEIIAWILENSGGVCEICAHPAPFSRSNGEPYLEVHHVRPLSEGGPDTVDNAVACCPNCHRSIHFSKDATSLRIAAISNLPRLKDYPVLLSVSSAEPG